MRSRNLIPLLIVASVFAKAQEPRKLRPFLSIAYTNGGDTLASVKFTDGSSSSIKAGGETLFKGGLDYQVIPAFSLQASYGLHTDSTKEAKNGGLDFKRTAVEGMGFWNATPHFRAGLGFRKTSDARVTGNGAASLSTIHFTSSTGTVIEGEFLTSVMAFGRGGLSLRYVNEKYSPSSVDGIGAVTGPSVDGSHFGIGFSWYF